MLDTSRAFRGGQGGLLFLFSFFFEYLVCIDAACMHDTDDYRYPWFLLIREVLRRVSTYLPTYLLYLSL